MIKPPACPMCAEVVADAPLCAWHERFVNVALRIQRGDYTDWPAPWPFKPDSITLQCEPHGPMGRPGHPWLVQVICTLTALNVWWEA